MGRAAPRRAGPLAVAAIAAVAVAAAAVPGCGRRAEVAPVPQGEHVPTGVWAKPVGTAITLEPLRGDADYRRAFFSTFTSATPENELKWDVIEPSRRRFAFAQADRVIDAAEAAGARVRGHPLVWDLQLPKWVEQAPSSQLEGILRAHVRRIASRYRGRIAQWDVVNEPLEDDGELTSNVFAAAMGEGYIDVAFAETKRADPKAKRFLNEIAAERGEKADGLVALVRRLRSRGVPIDGVGLQNHTTADDFPTRAELSRIMRRLAPLDVEITEMDVTIERPGEDPVPAWRAAAEACAAASNCTGLTVWGVTDKTSWMGPAKAATLFDTSGREKPALAAIRDVLGR